MSLRISFVKGNSSWSFTRRWQQTFMSWMMVLMGKRVWVYKTRSLSNSFSSYCQVMMGGLGGIVLSCSQK